MNILREPVRLLGVIGESEYPKHCTNNSSMYAEAEITQPTAAVVETIQTKPFPIRGENGIFGI